MLFLFLKKETFYQTRISELQKNYITLKDVDRIKKEKIPIKYIVKQLFNYEELKSIFMYIKIKKYRLKLNSNYINEKLKKYKELFDDVLGYPLDEEQRVAIVNDECYSLLLAGAGSGKTLTMIGKVLYLINEGIKPSEILVISFTNASVNSFINKISGYNLKIDVFTFHKLSMNIIKDKNIKVRILKDDVLENIMCKYKIKNDYKQLINSFIHFFKSENHKLFEFDYYLKKVINSKEKYELIKLIKKIYIEYSSYLEQKELIDFDDMINMAYELVDAKSFITKYKYILVDEYQDTSLIKFNLLKKILQLSNSKLVAVGDDWQSIYRFTGCELKIFLDFKKLFSYSEVLSINNTYRNSQELIDIASSFIVKNPYQLKKNINSKKSLINPVEIVLYNNFDKAIIYCLETIIEKYPKKEILILGRNNNDINFFNKKIFKITNNIINYKNYKIKYMTAHKSKGLESDNVIVINLLNKINGFPSKIINHEILSLVSKEKEDYIFDEERRLFYVALTRTKNKVYLLAPTNNYSLFVKEIICNKNIKITKI